MSFAHCPIDQTLLSTGMRCPTCGREWQSRLVDGQPTLISKPRRVRVVKPLMPGARLDECLEADIPLKPCGSE